MRLCTSCGSSVLENEENVGPVREESYPVTCLSQTPEDKGSMSPVSFHGSGMCPESLLDCD